MSSIFNTLLRTGSSAVFAVLLLAILSIPSAWAGQSQTFAPGYTAIKASFAAQPQWKRVMAVTAMGGQAKKETPWQRLVSLAGEERPLQQLDAVNRYFNAVPYAEDGKLYGVKDHWATPAEFVRNNGGDCEDYAVAKYTALRAMGWSADSLLIVAVRDHNYNVDHAILAAKVNGQWHYLDNRAPRLLSPSDVPEYQPVYALNEHKLSVFIKAKPTQEVAARVKGQPAHSG